MFVEKGKGGGVSALNAAASCMTYPKLAVEKKDGVEMHLLREQSEKDEGKNIYSCSMLVCQTIQRLHFYSVRNTASPWRLEVAMTIP